MVPDIKIGQTLPKRQTVIFHSSNKGSKSYNLNVNVTPYVFGSARCTPPKSYA